MMPTIPPTVPRVSTTGPTLATAITAALGVSVAAVAATLAVGLAVGLPIALQRFRAVGGGAGHEADPTPVIRLRYADRDDAALGMVNIGAQQGVFNAVEQTADGGYIAVGGAHRVGVAAPNDFDVVVVKLHGGNGDPSAEGSADWIKFYPQTAGGYDQATAVQQTDDDNDGQTDDGFVVVGTADKDNEPIHGTRMFLLKLDPTGSLDPSWTTANPVSYGGIGSNNKAAGVVQAIKGDGTNDGYLMVGSSSYLGVNSIYLSKVGVVRTDRLGQPIWYETENTKYYTLEYGTVDGFDQGFAVTQTDDDGDGIADDGFMLVGSSSGSEGVDPHPLLVRIDPSKKQQVTVFTSFGAGTARSITQTFDRSGPGRRPTGSVISGSLIGDAPRYEDAFLLKLQPGGNPDPTWAVNPRRYGGEGNDLAASVRQRFDAAGMPIGYVLAGGSNSLDIAFQTDGQFDVYAILTEQNGDPNKTYLPHREGTDLVSAIRPVVGSPSGYISVGFATITIDPGGQIKRVPEVIFYPGGSGPTPEPTFRRADSDDNGKIDLSDTIFTLNALFKGGPQPTCPDASDADDNGKIDLSDTIFTLNYLFKGSGVPPPAPGPDLRGLDPTADGLEACSYTAP